MHLLQARSLLHGGRRALPGGENRILQKNHALLPSGRPKPLSRLCILTYPGLFLQVGHKARICGIAFSHCGARVVTCANDEFTMVWCAKSGEVLAKHRLHGQGLWDSAVHFSVDGSQLAIRSTKKISIICATSGASLCRLWRPHEGKVSCATFSQDGLMLASGGGSHDPCVRIWDLQSGKVTAGTLTPSRTPEDLFVALVFKQSRFHPGCRACDSK
jgi:WD40 repeat protein